jgi:hypothetical protein
MLVQRVLLILQTPPSSVHNNLYQNDLLYGPKQDKSFWYNAVCYKQLLQ